MSADYVTMFGHSSAYVFAVTITDEGPERRSRDEKNDTGPSVTFHFLNGASDPLTAATLKIEAQADDFVIRFAELHSDRHGRIELPLPQAPVNVIGYTARNASGATRSGTIEFGGGNREAREESIVFDGK